MAAKASRGGSFHKVISPKALPAIYIKETRLVSQSFVATNRFVPQLLLRGGPTEKLPRSEEHTSELQSRFDLVCRLLLENKNNAIRTDETTFTRIDYEDLIEAG